MADDTGSDPEGDLTLETTTVTVTGHRRALWGVLAVVAVAAGALAVTARQDDGGLPRLPVALGASVGAESAAGMSAPAADMRMAWITYLAGDDLPMLGGEAVAYRVTGAVDEGRVRALAEAVGLSGDPVHEDGLWHLRTDDGVLEVYEDGGGSWWYSSQSFSVEPDVSNGGGSSGSPGCEPGPAVDCGFVEPVAPSTAIPGTAPTTTVVDADCPAGASSCVDDTSCRTYTAADGSTVEECTLPVEECPPNANCVAPEPLLPTPPADLPSEGDARQIALDLLSSTGMDVEGAKVTVDGPYDSWYVSVEPVLDGLPVSGWMSSVSVGSKGAITDASGSLATSERLGDYPVLDTRAAIERLNEQQGGWFAYAPETGAVMDSEGMTECTVGPDGSEACTTTDVGVACPDIAVASGDADGGFVEEPCPMPLPEPEPMEVTLHEAEQILVLLPSFDGSGDSYLLPGYRFTGDDDHMTEVAAVADDSLLPTPDTTAVPEPAPMPSECADVYVYVPGDSPATTTPGDCAGEIPPSSPELTHLSEGEAPQLGVPYYVDVNVMTGHCSWISVEFADAWYWAELSNDDLAPWSTPTEGGTFTLTAVGQAEFVGDAARTKVAKLALHEDGTTPPLCG